MTDTIHRIANLMPPGAAAPGYLVPAAAIGAGFSSEVVQTRAVSGFLNDLDFTTSELLYAEAGLRAERAGCSAVLINTVLDYGMRPLRAAQRVPVVGAGQAALQLATALADRFGILTVWPPVSGRLYQRLLGDYDLSSRCSGIRHVTENADLPHMTREGGLLDQIRQRRDDVLNQLKSAAHDLRSTGAEAIVLGCTCMSPVRDELANRLPCPVIDGLAAGHKLAETLVTLGLTQPAPRVAPMFADLAHTMAAASSQLTAPSTADTCGDICEVLSADPVS